MESKADHPNGNKRRPLRQSLLSHNGVRHHHLCLAETQRQTGVGKLRVTKNLGSVSFSLIGGCWHRKLEGGCPEWGTSFVIGWREFLTLSDLKWGQKSRKRAISDLSPYPSELLAKEAVGWSSFITSGLSLPDNTNRTCW